MLKKEKISKLKPDPANPRTITEKEMNELIDSLISFPQMMSLRPIVRNSKNETIAGNMRVQALKEILKLKAEGFARRFTTLPNGDRIDEKQRAFIFQFWTEFFEKKEVTVMDASDLTPEQQKEFIIKDNTHFGRWDMDKLANEWDAAVLPSWGLNIDLQASFEEKPESSNEDAVKDGQGSLKEDAEATNFIIPLEYTPEDYHKVMDAFKKIGGAPEGIVFGLLGLNIE